MMDCATTSQPGHTNHLVHATSPYLLQHAHNPVDWYPWGPEALDKSRRESKLIFLSIGYAACHWCHVMERESFEDAEIAQILNDSFVAIKVDREERPDLDEVYMSATMLANQGQGGWPMSVFLTPDQRPFFAGTYFPPHSAYGRPGFRDLLLEIARMWREEPVKVAEYSRNLAEGVRQMATPATSDETIPRATITGTVDMLARAFDRQSGGLPGGNGTKFPPSMTMSLMLRECRHGKRTGKAREELLGLVELTLDHMARGGIYDHLGGGISRYSTDSDWLVPHFEKMLYDQALVSAVYFEAFELTGRRRYADVGCNILDYVLADLQSPEGAFYSSRDADSEGVEGKYYVWSKPEVISILGERAGELFCSYYDVTDSGNWEGRNILNVQRDVETVARLNSLSLSELSASLGSSRAKLLQLRSRRVPPGLDDKILTSWNGLIISSLARGARVTGQVKYAEAATKAAEFILAHMSRNGRLLRTSRNGTAHTGGFLDDYAFFTEGLLDLYESTFETRRLDEAIRLTDLTIEHFWDTERGGFFSTANDAEQLIVRSKDSRDGAIPSGNSVALMNLVRLAVMLDRKDLQAKAEATMKAYGSTIRQSPGAFDRFLAAADFYHRLHTEVVLVGSPTHPGTRALLEAIRQVYDPGRVVLLLDPADPVAPARQAAIPLLAGKTLIDGNPAAYVCRNYVCRRPVTSPQALARELQAE